MHHGRMLTCRAVLGALVLAACLLTVGCTPGSPPSAAPPGDPSATGPRQPVVPALQEPGTRMPGTTHVELCAWLGRDRPERTVSLVLPDRFVKQDSSRRHCDFRSGLANEVFLTLGTARSLAEYRDRSLAPHTGEAGDDAISSIDYTAHVAFFGASDGERLSWTTYDDGSPLDVVLLQAGGVRLQWQARRGRLDAQRDEVAATLASIGVLEGTSDLCTDGDATSRVTVRFLVPDGMRGHDSDGATCVLRLSPPVPLGHAASFDLHPPRTLAGVRDRLPEGARAVTFARGVPGMRAGGPADRLEFTTAGDPALHVTIVQQGAVRLSWRATLAQWRDERTTFEDLRRSVRAETRL